MPYWVMSISDNEADVTLLLCVIPERIQSLEA